MTKRQAFAFAKKYGMGILRDHITNEAYGFVRVFPDAQPDLDELAAASHWNFIRGVAETTMFEAYPHYNGYPEWDGVEYRLICPPSWFDLWGSK